MDVLSEVFEDHELRVWFPAFVYLVCVCVCVRVTQICVSLKLRQNNESFVPGLRAFTLFAVHFCKCSGMFDQGLRRGKWRKWPTAA